MQIHRSRHARGFTVLPNAVLQDRRLSYTARGLLADLLSRPDGWREDGRRMADTSPQGRLAVAKALRELTEFGYYRVERVRQPDGTFVSRDPRLRHPAGRTGCRTSGPRSISHREPWRQPRKEPRERTHPPRAAHDRSGAGRAGGPHRARTPHRSSRAAPPGDRPRAPPAPRRGRGPDPRTPGSALAGPRPRPPRPRPPPSWPACPNGSTAQRRSSATASPASCPRSRSPHRRSPAATSARPAHARCRTRASAAPARA